MYPIVFPLVYIVSQISDQLLQNLELWMQRVFRSNDKIFEQNVDHVLDKTNKPQDVTNHFPLDKLPIELILFIIELGVSKYSIVGVNRNLIESMAPFIYHRMNFFIVIITTKQLIHECKVTLRGGYDKFQHPYIELEPFKPLILDKYPIYKLLRKVSPSDYRVLHVVPKDLSKISNLVPQLTDLGVKGGFKSTSFFFEPHQ